MMGEGHVGLAETVFVQLVEDVRLDGLLLELAAEGVQGRKYYYRGVGNQYLTYR